MRRRIGTGIPVNKSKKNEKLNRVEVAFKDVGYGRHDGGLAKEKMTCVGFGLNKEEIYGRPATR